MHSHTFLLALHPWAYDTVNFVGVNFMHNIESMADPVYSGSNILTLLVAPVVALGPLHDKIRLSPRVLPRRKVPDQKGNEMTSHSNVRESA